MQKTFEEVLDIKNGKNQKKVLNPDGEYPIYGSGGIMGYADEYICGANTVVIGRKGSINKPIYVETPFWNVDTAFGLVAKIEYLLPKYLFYFCKYFDFERLSTTVTIPSLTKANLLKIKIDVPELTQQKEEVDILDKINQLIDARKEQLNDLDNLIKSRFVEMFGNPDKNEKQWEQLVFGDICKVRQGLQIPITNRLTKKLENCYKYLTIAYLNGKKEAEFIQNPKKTVICSEEDLLMTRTGNTGMIITNVEGVFHNNFFLIEFDRNRYNKTFLYHYLNMEYIQIDIVRRADTSTIPDLNHGEFYKVLVYEPPIELQNDFELFTKHVDKLKVEFQKSLDETQILFDSLMQEYFE